MHMNKLKELFQKKSTPRDDRWIFGSLFGAALVGLLASFVLSVEALQLAKNPQAVLECSISLVLNCATVALHSSASVFGFPNSFIGMMTLPVMVTIAVAGLAGVRFPRLFMLGAQIGATVGLLFAIWMFYMSFAVIQVLCPWCLTLDAAMLFIFFAITRYNIRENNLYLPHSVMEKLQAWCRKDYDKLLLYGLIVLGVAMIIVKYGNELFA